MIILAAGTQSASSSGLSHGEDWLALAIVLALGLSWVAAGVIVWSNYIQVDDSTLTLGSLLLTRRCARSDIVAIRARRTLFTRLTGFVRRDGSSAFGTSGYIWGERQLRAVAEYLGVPLIR